MPLMQGPDGEVADVPAEDIQHYLGLGGFSLVGQSRPGGTTLEEYGIPSTQFTGTPEQPVEEPLFSPLDLVPGGGFTKPGLAASRVASGTVRGTGQVIGRGAARVGEAAGRLMSSPGGKAALKFGLRRIPFVDLAIDAADLVGSATARTAGKEAAEAGTKAVGSAASRATNPASEAGRQLSQARWAKAPKPKPKGKVVGKIEPKPKVGSAESRVKETLPERAAKNRQRQKDNRRSPQMRQQPQIKPPEGDLMEQLQRSLKAEKAMEQLGLSEAEKEVARKLLIQGQ